jgi:hypothetical protein
MNYSLDSHAPQLKDGAWVADNAVLIGRIILEARSSIWFNCVLRGDNEPITIGEGSNIQDGSVLHTDVGIPLTVGRDCGDSEQSAHRQEQPGWRQFPGDGGQAVPGWGAHHGIAGQGGARAESAGDPVPEAERRTLCAERRALPDPTEATPIAEEWWWKSPLRTNHLSLPQRIPECRKELRSYVEKPDVATLAPAGAEPPIRFRTAELNPRPIRPSRTFSLTGRITSEHRWEEFSAHRH